MENPRGRDVRTGGGGGVGKYPIFVDKQYITFGRGGQNIRKCCGRHIWKPPYSADMPIFCRKNLFLSPSKVILGWVQEVIYTIKCNCILQKQYFLHIILIISAEIICFCHYMAETEISVIFSHINWFLCFVRSWAKTVSVTGAGVSL